MTDIFPATAIALVGVILPFVSILINAGRDILCEGSSDIVAAVVLSG